MAALIGVGVTGSVSATSVSEPSLSAAQAAGPVHPLNILLTNDDGWRGPGGSSTPLIVALRDALRAAGHHVVVVAPGTDQSGQGGRFSLPPNQLTVANPESDVWTVTPGSPSDSVYFAFDKAFAHGKPDLVVSGINPGNNMGSAISHSGTVNAATTALELGVPAIAVSLGTVATWPGGTQAATPDTTRYVVGLIARLEATARKGRLMPDGVALNVNVPVRPGPIDPATGMPGSALPAKGRELTTLSTGQALALDYQPVPGQAGTYSVSLSQPDTSAPQGTDTRAVEDGFISVTPLEADRDVDGATKGWARSVL